MKTIYYLFIIIIIASSCKKESDGVCATEPFSTYEWLLEIRSDLQDSETSTSIAQYVYNNNCVYEVNYGAYVDGEVLVYNEQGEEICKFGGLAGYNTCPDFYEKASDAKIIFEQ